MRVCSKQGCPTLTDGRVCPQHRKQEERIDRDRRGTSHQRGYGGKQWERLRRRVLVRDLFKCQDCGALVMGKGEAHVDHVIAKRDGGKDEVENLQVLCHPCHSIKTREENR